MRIHREDSKGNAGSIFFASTSSSKACLEEKKNPWRIALTGVPCPEISLQVS
jgi:hypothetical protein